MVECLAGGNIAIALRDNTLATGAMLAVLVPEFGDVSGAHFSRSVTARSVRSPGPPRWGRESPR